MGSYGLLVLCHIQNGDKAGRAGVRAFIEVITWLYFLTELLSCFYGLTFRNLLVSWGMLDIALLFLLGYWTWKRRKRGKRIKKDITEKRAIILQMGTLCVIWIACILLALKTVPYNWDSMMYHLPRIAYWRQNQSVAHYATNEVRQITSPVLAEFVNLHLYILMKGDDRFINLLQTVSFIFNSLLIYGIANKLTENRKWAGWLAAILFVTMPIAFAEALTTQVDHFATIWPLILAYLILDYVDTSRPFVWNKRTVLDVLYMSLAIAFGYLAKPSVMFAMLFMAVWVLAVCFIRRDSINVVGKLLLCAICVMGIVLTPEILRNVFTFHALSDPSVGARQLIGTRNPIYILVNFLKNIVWNLPSVYVKGSLFLAEDFIYRLSNFLHVSINDESISEGGNVFRMIEPRTYSHDTAINPVILYATILCCIWMICRVRKMKLSEKREGFSPAVIGAFLCFCAVLRWESFVSRYMLTYFALLCPVVSAQFFSWLDSSVYKRICYMILGAFLMMSFAEWNNMMFYHAVISKYTDQVADRAYGYFYWQPKKYDIFLKTADFIIENDYKKIGFLTSASAYEYPMIKMLDSYVDRIEHINVTNDTGKYEDSDYRPDCIVTWYTLEQIEYHGEVYSEVFHGEDSFSVLSLCGD